MLDCLLLAFRFHCSKRNRSCVFFSIWRNNRFRCYCSLSATLYSKYTVQFSVLKFIRFWFWHSRSLWIQNHWKMKKIELNSNEFVKNQTLDTERFYLAFQTWNSDIDVLYWHFFFHFKMKLFRFLPIHKLKNENEYTFISETRACFKHTNDTGSLFSFVAPLLKVLFEIVPKANQTIRLLAQSVTRANRTVIRTREERKKNLKKYD